MAEIRVLRCKTPRTERTRFGAAWLDARENVRSGPLRFPLEIAGKIVKSPRGEKRRTASNRARLCNVCSHVSHNFRIDEREAKGTTKRYLHHPSQTLLRRKRTSISWRSVDIHAVFNLLVISLNKHAAVAARIRSNYFVRTRSRLKIAFLSGRGITSTEPAPLL